MSDATEKRRRFLKGIAGLTASASVVACSNGAALDYAFSGPAPDRNLGLKAFKPCTAGTRSQTAGPFYTPSTPKRSDLTEPDSKQLTLRLEGLVLNTDCEPVSGAVIDIWHCDEHGHYDNSGFRYRGHQYTDAAGSYRFTTIRPSIYTGRTEHIHVKVQGKGTRLLTTQLYFPDRSKENASDRIFKSELLMSLKRLPEGWYGRFDFIL